MMREHYEKNQGDAVENDSDTAEILAMNCNIVELLNSFLKVEDIPPMEPNGYLVRECITLAKTSISALSHFDHVIPLALPFMPQHAESIIRGIARSGNWQLLANMSAVDEEFLRNYKTVILRGFEKECLMDAAAQFLAATDFKKLGAKKNSQTKEGLFYHRHIEQDAMQSPLRMPRHSS